MRGDDVGSNRLADNLLSGTVPIITERGQYDILPDWFNWSYFTEFADVSDRKKFKKDIDRIVHQSETDYLTKQEWITQHEDLFDFHNPRCMCMYFREFLEIIEELDVTSDASWDDVRRYQQVRRDKLGRRNNFATIYE